MTQSENTSPTIPISALQHFSYCPRQCALIHVEQVFDENVYTLRGQFGHERADNGRSETETARGVRIERALPLWSDSLGLSGRGDVVEFYADGRVVPVEYKHGPRRASRHDEIQLCAQALCLEEMLGATVDEGVVYSLTTHRRRAVAFDAALRQATLDAVAGTRRLLLSEEPLPPALADGRCPKCSLIDACIPDTLVRASTSGKRAQNRLYDGFEPIFLDQEEHNAA